jgi:hypothetical protein
MAGARAAEGSSAGPFDSLAKSARSPGPPSDSPGNPLRNRGTQGSGLDAQKGRKNRNPLWCPEPGTPLTNREIWSEIEVISVSAIDELSARAPYP